jgi:hypothetical protein
MGRRRPALFTVFSVDRDEGDVHDRTYRVRELGVAELFCSLGCLVKMASKAFAGARSSLGWIGVY